jgi:glutamine amidotransferase
MVAIIDYGMGNIHSVQKALEFCGAKTGVTNKPADIRNADKVILPGVGAFADAMDELKRKGLIGALAEYIKNKKPFLGICLGMQLLFEGSDEAKDSAGLGVLKGRVKLFDKKRGLKVPHMGWNQLKKAADKCPLLKDIPEGSYVYFCHSYYPWPNDTKVVAATTDYGIDFASMVWRDNIYGVQFHPEKSQDIGLKILKNFVNLC